MESQDYDTLKQESKEQNDREIYQDILSDFKQGLEDILCQANKDKLDTDDIVEAIETVFENCSDMKIKIERVCNE